MNRDLFSYTNGAYEFCFEFCVVEVFKFWVKDSMDYGIRIGKSPSLGMSKSTQGTFQ